MDRERELVLALATSANTLLDRYIGVHDALYAGSPFRKLFSRTDYGRYASQLHTTASEFAAIRQQAIDSRAGRSVDRASAAFLDEFIPYLEAVMDAGRRLDEICRGLDSKARRTGNYDSSTYSRDSNNYKAAVARYQSLGSSLNPLFEALQDD